MKTFLLLLKNSLFNGFYSNQNRSKKKKKPSNPFATLIYVGLLFLFISIMYNYIFSSSFFSLGLGNIYLQIVLVLSGLLTLFMTVLRVNQSIYQTKDYELLESLPISKTKIVASKICSIYIYDLATTLIMVLPAIAFYLIFQGDIVVALLALLYTFLVSFIPLAIAVLIGFLFTLLTAKFKYRNLLTIILYVLFFVVIFGVSFLFGFSSSADTIDPDTVKSLSSIFSFYPPGEWILKSFEGDMLYALLFIGVSIVSIAIAILVVGLTYKRINNWLSSGGTHNKYVLGKQKGEKSARTAFFKKELSMIFKNPMCLVNFIMVPFIGAILLIVFPMLFKIDASESANDSFDISGFMYFFPIALSSYMCGISNYTISSFSLEGKSMNLLKTLPLDAKDIVGIKLLIGVLFPEVIMFIGATVFSIVFQPPFYVIIGVYIIPLLSILVVGLLGMITGLKWPVLNWDNQTAAMKNSKSSLVTTFSCLGIQMIGIVLGTILVLMLGPNLTFVSYIVLGVFELIFVVTFGIILKSKYRKLYSQINCN